MTSVAVVAAVVVLVAVGTLVLSRRRVAVWRRFARAHRLTYDRDDHGDPRVTGEIDGRTLRLEVMAESSDRGWFAVEPVELSLTTAVEPPPGLQVAPRTAIDKVVGEEGIETGDPVFDRLARVSGDDSDRVRNFLTAPRRAAVASLLEAVGSDPVGMRGATLFIRRRRALSRREVLERDLRTLLEAARGIDGASR